VQNIGAETHRLERPGAEIFDQDLRAGDQIGQQLAATRRTQI
jgi:hypothetical protein